MNDEITSVRISPDAQILHIRGEHSLSDWRIKDGHFIRQVPMDVSSVSQIVLQMGVLRVNADWIYTYDRNGVVWKQRRR